MTQQALSKSFLASLMVITTSTCKIYVRGSLYYSWESLNTSRPKYIYLLQSNKNPRFYLGISLI